MADAWDRFYGEHAPSIRAGACSRKVPGVDPEDAAQEAWLALLERLRRHRPDGSRGRLRDWIYILARHRLVDLRRQAARRPARNLATEVLASVIGRDDSVGSAADREETGELVRQILEEFRLQVSRTSYRVIYLRWIEGRTMAEVATALGLTPDQARARHHRMMKRLRVLAERRGVSARP